MDASDDRPWVFDLIADDIDARRRAVRRHRAAVAHYGEARGWANRIWRDAGTPRPTEPHLAAEMDQAEATLDRHLNDTVFGYLDRFSAAAAGSVDRSVYAPFAVLYLRWEHRYPAAWRDPEVNLWSPWSRKEVVLADLARHGFPADVEPAVAELVVAALRRPYRCKDWRFAPLIRHLAVDFRDRLRPLLRSEAPLIAARARFAFHLAEHPDVPVTRTTWRRWLHAEPHTLTSAP